jgi:tRNA (cmo5U34)-methyltransferase
LNTDPGMRALLAPFQDPAAVSHYTEGPPRFVPGFADLHKMTSILLGENTPDNAHVLVVGAGGGLELRAWAQDHPHWRFVGVDPARPMLDLAKKTLGPLAARVELHEGYVDDAPEGPFDAASCLLTLHFLDAAERQRTLEQIRKRMKPGAPFIAVHASFPQGQRDTWLARYAAFAIASGVERDKGLAMREKIAANLSMFSPAEDESILKAAGFRDITPFYAAFTWRGWIAYA